jgi:hypothetical protein
LKIKLTIGYVQILVFVRLPATPAKEKDKTIAAAKAGIAPKITRKYVKIGKLPSQIKCKQRLEKPKRSV